MDRERDVYRDHFETLANPGRVISTHVRVHPATLRRMDREWCFIGWDIRIDPTIRAGEVVGQDEDGRVAFRVWINGAIRRRWRERRAWLVDHYGRVDSPTDFREAIEWERAHAARPTPPNVGPDKEGS